MNHSNNVEARVLQHYQAINPSWTCVDTLEAWQALVERRLRIFRDRLHLPSQMFRGAHILDMGCGTGEHTAVYASWGAFVSGVEFNPLSIERLRWIFERYGLSDQLITLEPVSIHDWTPPSGPTYDFAISDGVLHHLADAHEGFMKLAGGVKRGGFVVISTAPLPGAEQRWLMRQLIQRFASSLEEAITLVKQWFPEYLDRATRLGHRTTEQVVSDNFLTPQNQPLPIETVLEWLAEAGLSLYRSWPPLEPELADPASHLPIDWLRPTQRTFLSHRAAHWTYQREGDPTRFANQLGDAEVYARRTQWVTEFKQIQQLLEREDREALSHYLPICKIVGRGCCGVGEWWIVGVKT